MTTNYAGLCALIAVSSVSLAVLIGVAGLAWHGRTLAEPGAEVLSLAVGGLIALTGTYIGGLLGSNKPAP